MIAAVTKSKERYNQRCIEVNHLVSSKPGLPPKEMEKTKIKLDKAQSLARQADLDYCSNIERLGDIHRRWEEDMRTACKVGLYY